MFLNIVLDEAVEETDGQGRKNIGMVVRSDSYVSLAHEPSANSSTGHPRQLSGHARGDGENPGRRARRTMNTPPHKRQWASRFHDHRECIDGKVFGLALFGRKRGDANLGLHAHDDLVFCLVEEMPRRYKKRCPNHRI